MTKEEKAKRYDIALDKIKRLLGSGSNCSREELEYVFPELKESEDEKIRKDLITFLDDIWHLGKNANFDKWGKADCSDWIAWLEKQAEKGTNGNEREIPFDAWSEEDEKQARQIERIIHDDGCTQKLQKQIADWLKSLKYRYTWKPSEEQMEALKGVQEGVFRLGILESLYQDLKKLMEK